MNEPDEVLRRRRRRRRWLAAGAAALVLPNAFAAAHAWTLTHYAEGGERPRSPQELTAGERLQRLLLGVRVPRPVDAVRPWGPYDQHDIEVPSLVLHGEADPTVPIEAARELTAALGPRARLVLLPGVGHVSLVGAAPEAWEAATTALLDEVAPP